MKKIFLFSIFIILFLSPSAFSDRNTATTTIYSQSQLIKTGEAKIYSVSFVATANAGYFFILDSLTNTASGGSITNIKTEGSEATSGNGSFQDFSNKPLEFSTGIYLVVSNGYVIVRHE